MGDTIPVTVSSSSSCFLGTLLVQMLLLKATCHLKLLSVAWNIIALRQAKVLLELTLPMPFPICYFIFYFFNLLLSICVVHSLRIDPSPLFSCFLYEHERVRQKTPMWLTEKEQEQHLHLILF